jgi:cysteine desulfurase / selenocysteine lyase
MSKIDTFDCKFEFPVLNESKTTQQSADGNPLVYLDSAATTQKPQSVIDSVTSFLSHSYGTVHRGAYALSVKASDKYEAVREQVAKYVGGGVLPSQVVFTRGTTESINLLASGCAQFLFDQDSRIVVSAAEHHANLVPWQQAALKSNCEIGYIPLKGNFHPSEMILDLEKAQKIINSRTKLVSLAHVGNVLGQVNPVGEIVALAQKVGAKVVLDCAQSASCFPLDWLNKGVDALAFSGHKVFGPSGVGVLIMSQDWMKKMPPLLFGGGMISNVTLEESTFAEGPAKFEAGTPPITEVIGLGAALSWVEEKGRSNIHSHSAALALEFRQILANTAGVQLFGPNTGQESIVAFRIEDTHAHDAATILDSHNIAVRAGHHCAWPLIRSLKVDALLRASFSAYSTQNDVIVASKAIQRISESGHKS